MTDVLTVLEDAARLLGTYSSDLQGQVLNDDDSITKILDELGI